MVTPLPKTKREWACTYAMRMLGLWYTWGGDDPSGWDCSGLAGEILSATGIVPRKYDNTAAGQYADMKRMGKPCGLLLEAAVENAVQPGWLIFFSKTDNPANIYHVEIAVSCGLSIGASGGDSTTKTLADAIRQNAFIKLRPIAGRGYKLFWADPFSPDP